MKDYPLRGILRLLFAGFLTVGICLLAFAEDSALAPAEPPQWSVLEDADQDGLTDWDEFILSLDPLNPVDGLSDVDGDELWLSWEWHLGTDSDLADTDGDGWSDSLEVLLYGTDPLDPASKPINNGADNLDDAPATLEVEQNSTLEEEPPPPPSLSNGNFSEIGIQTWKDQSTSKSYQGGGFKWGEGTASSWSAYVGTTIEVWQANGETFVELDGNATNYGIKQTIANVCAGTFILAWKQSGRNDSKSGTNPYFVRVYYEGETSPVIISDSREFSGYDKLKWTDNAHAFQITPDQITAANGKPIYVAFIPTSLNTYGTLIDQVSLLPVEVIFYKSDTESNDDWNSPEKILPDGEIYLIQAKDPEPIKFKVSVSAKITEEQFKPLKLYATSILGENSKSSNQKATNFSLSELSKVTFHQTDNGSTARCQIDQDLWKSKFVMQSAKDSVFSVDWSDFDLSEDKYAESTYEDSDIFDQAFEKILYSLNGKARGEGNWTEKEIIDFVGKISSWSVSAYSSSFKAAGYCRFTLNSTSCAVMEQAKIAYFSTHGAHSYNIRLGGYPTGVIETAELSSDPTQPKRIYLKPEDMEWHAGLDVAVMAACAVLDVNDYNNNFKGADHLDSPGERWEKTGPRILLGYNYSAPIDIPNGLAVSKQWTRLVTTTNQDPITCWALATYNHKAYHSCAIEKGVGYWYYPVKKDYYKMLKKTKFIVSPWKFVEKSKW